MTITEPGVFNISADDYHADRLCATPSLSSGIARELIYKTPWHAWNAHPRLNPQHEAEESSRFDIGSAAHSLMLGDPKTFEVVNADNWTTKAAKEARDHARANGKIPLLGRQCHDVYRMVEAGREQLAAHEEASDAFSNGTPEQTLIWQEGEAWCRCRLDWLPASGAIFYDYKTTDSANPETWKRIVFNLGHEIQDAFYRRGIEAVLKIQNPVFRFVVQETSPPFALCVMDIDPETAYAAEFQVNDAINQWRWCMQNSEWPGYPRKVVTISAPAWHAKQVLEREENKLLLMRERGYNNKLELFRDAFVRQAPI